MVTATPKKVFTELQLYLWRLRYDTEDEWRPEVYLMGSDATLKTIRDSLESMKSEFIAEKQSSRKFLCNPPEDFDVARFVREQAAEIEWQIWLIFRMKIANGANQEPEIRNKAVTVWLDEQLLNQFIQVLNNQLTKPDEYQRGQNAPGGLFLVTDWLGTK